jgi:hypothetical protein
MWILDRINKINRIDVSGFLDFSVARNPMAPPFLPGSQPDQLYQPIPLEINEEPF